MPVAVVVATWSSMVGRATAHQPPLSWTGPGRAWCAVSRRSPNGGWRPRCDVVRGSGHAVPSVAATTTPNSWCQRAVWRPGAAPACFILLCCVLGAVDLGLQAQPPHGPSCSSHCWRVEAAVSTGERQALVDVYLASNLTQTSGLTGWSSYSNLSVDPCTPTAWQRVTCLRTPDRVV